MTVVHAVNVSTIRRRVELSCVAINGPLDAIAGRPSCVIGITRHTPGTYRCSGVYDISVTKIKRLLTETRSSAIAATALVTIQD